MRHTPWLSDRDLALENVRYVRDACGDLAEDFVPSPDGLTPATRTDLGRRAARPAECSWAAH
ncbi:lysine 5,6-aminomutase subunit alpha TIM-barrel domain-containing protein [Actinomadura miaoliensis]|uniref:D-Lysine 5,6-aminomutase alpha subunit domain-containing protein n=1 Tax=Actinomadura miaoliensis TaxID=430685 RepID=A0ABP7UYP3_9ACTN